MGDWGAVTYNKSYSPGSDLPFKAKGPSMVQHMLDHHGVAEDNAVDLAEDPHSFHSRMHHGDSDWHGAVAENTVPHTHEFGGTQFPKNVQPHAEGEGIQSHLEGSHPDISLGSDHSPADMFKAHQHWHHKNDHKDGATTHVHSDPEHPQDHDSTMAHLKTGHDMDYDLGHIKNPIAYHQQQHEGSYNHNLHNHVGPKPEAKPPEHHEHEHVDSTDHLKAMHNYTSEHLKGKNQTQLSHEHQTLHQDMEGPADHYHPENGGAQPWKAGTPKGPLNEMESLQAHLNYGHNEKPDSTKQNYGHTSFNYGHQQNLSKHMELHGDKKSPTHSHNLGEGVLGKGTVAPDKHPTPKEDLHDDPEELHAHWVSHHWDASKGELPAADDHNKLVYNHGNAHSSDSYNKSNVVPHSHKAKGEDKITGHIKHPHGYIDMNNHMVLQHGMDGTGSYSMDELKEHHQMSHNQNANPAHHHEEEALDENHKESTITSHQGSADLLDFFKENA